MASALLASAALLVTCYAVPWPVVAAPHQVADEELVVQFASAAQAHAARDLHRLPGEAPVALPADRWLLRVPPGAAEGVISWLSSQPGVNYVAVNEPVHAADLPDNPCYSATCGPTAPVTVLNPGAGAGVTQAHPSGETDLWAVNAAQAWGYTHGDPNMLVAVLDTGVSTENAQLRSKVVQGPDVCADDDAQCASPQDNNGHGTFVAGLIAATNDDGLGMASLGWDVNVLSIKILDDQGQGGTVDEATGIYDAVKMGAKVINLSTSDYPCNVNAKLCGPDPDIAAAVRYALGHGVTVVAAAGNWDETQPVYPASYPGVLAVAGATDQRSVNPPNGGAYLDFSEYGNAANIAAPAVDILSTWNDGDYAVASGTSFAVPLVSAAAALVLSVDPRLSPPQVATLLRATASPLAPGSSPVDGGFLNVGAAVRDAYEDEVPAGVDGYQMAESDGAVLSAGSAINRGSLSGHHLAKPVVGIAATADGLGYWLVGADGGVFAFGDAGYYGSAGPLKLHEPIVGMAATPDGRGYWLVGADGGVFSFGDAHYWGSAVTHRSKAAIVGITASADGGGYWLVSSDGGVYAFGDAPFYGSEAGSTLEGPVVGLAASPFGTGYWIVTSKGEVSGFGSAHYEVPGFAKFPGGTVVGITS